jgi:hypothetical protein
LAITPSLRNKAKQALPKGQEKTRAQRLKRFFGMEIETCEQCGGAVNLNSAVEIHDKVSTH